MCLRFSTDFRMVMLRLQVRYGIRKFTFIQFASLSVCVCVWPWLVPFHHSIESSSQFATIKISWRCEQVSAAAVWQQHKPTISIPSPSPSSPSNDLLENCSFNTETNSQYSAFKLNWLEAEQMRERWTVLDAGLATRAREWEWIVCAICVIREIIFRKWKMNLWLTQRAVCVRACVHAKML